MHTADADADVMKLLTAIAMIMVAVGGRDVRSE